MFDALCKEIIKHVTTEFINREITDEEMECFAAYIKIRQHQKFQVTLKERVDAFLELQKNNIAEWFVNSMTDINKDKFLNVAYPSIAQEIKDKSIRYIKQMILAGLNKYNLVITESS